MAALFLLAAALAPGLGQEAGPAHRTPEAISPLERHPDIPIALINETPLGPPVEKPARFGSFRERLDFLHRNMQPTLRDYVVLLDEVFRDEAVWLAPPEARFRLLLENETRVSRQEREYRFEPNLDADFTLPHLERRWKLYLRSRSRDTITDREEEGDEEGRTTRLGVRSPIRETGWEADSGVRFRVQPEAYTRVQWARPWTADYWIIKPGQRVFYETDDGLGTLSQITFHRWLGRRPRVFLQFHSDAEISQRSDGVELGQSFRLGKVREALEPMDQWTRMMGDRDIANGSVVRLSMHGHVEGSESLIDGYRAGFIHREPLYRKWMYLSVNPDLLWENDGGWATEFRLRIGLDMLFWGSAER